MDTDPCGANPRRNPEPRRALYSVVNMLATLLLVETPNQTGLCSEMKISNHLGESISLKRGLRIMNVCLQYVRF